MRPESAFPALRIPLFVEERAGIARRDEIVQAGVPLPRGVCTESDSLCVTDVDGQRAPCQSRVTALWPDGSVQWLLVEWLASVAPASQAAFYLEREGPGGHGPSARIAVETSAASIRIDTGAASFLLNRRGAELMTVASAGGVNLLGDPGLGIRMREFAGREYLAVADEAAVAVGGPVRCIVTFSGRFRCGARRSPLVFTAAMSLAAGSTAATFELIVRNPLAARHRGNLWDLGDVGSCPIRDLSIDLPLRQEAASCSWYPEPRDDYRRHPGNRWRLYQDSSGGENWNSSNHVNARGELTVRFRGYRVDNTATGEQLQEGLRATPGVAVWGREGGIAATVEDFWQNFPKALRVSGNALSVGLWPQETCGAHELQGGEQKRHRAYLAFGAGDLLESLQKMQEPLRVHVAPSWIEASGALPYFTLQGDAEDARYRQYIETIVDGPASFFARREVIDEYGWRNFGETYADHEAVGHDGDRPLVSHFNNQYDFLAAAATHFLRTGRHSWWQLARQAANHVIDIDIYHTSNDRAAYSGGLFWHTDHYRDAATATHRTYSRHNAAGSTYGGGPSNEHNYTTGLLLYFFLTGDDEARAAVLELANWVIAMDDGSDNVFAIVDRRPTGRASSTVSPDYHKPGRGAGNSINALLDAYSLTGDSRYLVKAEELIHRCIHPRDDVDALGLDNPETRWSYLVFLQVLDKYLGIKYSHNQCDLHFFHARDSLLHYANWMLHHEVPYRDVLHKVDIPTETWPAQDIRKACIMHFAAIYSRGDERRRYADKAGFFYHRCLDDLLSFETACLARPRVILAAYGYVPAFFARHGYATEMDDVVTRSHEFDLGDPENFKPQNVLIAKLSNDRWRAYARTLLQSVRKHLRVRSVR